MSTAIDHGAASAPAADRRDPPGRHRGWVRWGAAALAVAMVILWIGPRGGAGPPLDPRSTGPAGTKALVDVLEELGVSVVIDAGVPDPADTAALVISDTTTADQRTGLRSWASSGGTLVVADPLSELAPDLVGLTAIAFTEPTIQPDCEDPATIGVQRVSVADAFVFDLPPGATGCFPRNDGFWLVRQSVGAGAVVSLGGPFTLTNDLLDAADNAVLLVNLLTSDPDPRVRIVTGDDPDAATDTLGDVLPDQVAVALLQVPLAWLAVLWWRGRRLGHPVREEPPVRLDAAETTLAVGNLMHRAGLASDAAVVIRRSLRTDLTSRLGVPATMSDDDLVAIAADRTGTPAEQLATILLAPVPTDDDGLTRFANAAAHLRRQIREHRQDGPPTNA